MGWKFNPFTGSFDQTGNSASNLVTSVAGKIGDVTLNNNDVSGLGGLATLSTVPASLVSGLANVATSGTYSSLTGLPTIPSAQINSDWNSSSGVSKILNKPTIPVPLCPFDPRSSLSFSYDGSGNIQALTYTYGGATQGFADFTYDGLSNLSTITYTATNHTTVLRTITFSYSGANISGYTVA